MGGFVSATANAEQTFKAKNTMIARFIGSIEDCALDSAGLFLEHEIRSRDEAFLVAPSIAGLPRGSRRSFRRVCQRAFRVRQISAPTRDWFPAFRAASQMRA